jgi:hypothetical protein
VTFWLIVILGSAGGWLWLRNKRLRAEANPVDDPEALEAAERDLDDLDAMATPEDAEEHLEDWGPGAPR